MVSEGDDGQGRVGSANGSSFLQSSSSHVAAEGERGGEHQRRKQAPAAVARFMLRQLRCAQQVSKVEVEVKVEVKVEVELSAPQLPTLALACITPDSERTHTTDLTHAAMLGLGV